ncbi:hypothetical protein MCOR25_006698 [Pyricularia grisea]|nr:hypothetical protein MCOR25_006698 [Pyricularia grisea]
MWKTGLGGWARDYEPHLEIFLQAMEEQEAGTHRPHGRLGLAEYMRESWRTGRFWLDYAARRSWAFDGIFWTYLDERFYGKLDYSITEEQRWQTRLQLLTNEEQDAMEPFLKRKMDESKQRVLVQWSDADAAIRLSEILLE